MGGGGQIAIPRPYHRNYRGFVPGPNSGYSQWAYIVDRSYAQFPEHYVRAFLLIQHDLLDLFEYVEPSDLNLDTYSHRIYNLFIRACIEIEANFKAILRENIYTPTSKGEKPRTENEWNMTDYIKVNVTHHLSSYKVHLPIWSGKQSTIVPFEDWNRSSHLSWYRAYNISKHDRAKGFESANFSNMLHAVSGLLALLSSQFGTQDFSPTNPVLGLDIDSYYSNMPGESAIGGYFRVEFPNDWRDEEMYDFNWSVLKSQSHRFDKFNYNLV